MRRSLAPLLALTLSAPAVALAQTSSQPAASGSAAPTGAPAEPAAQTASPTEDAPAQTAPSEAAPSDTAAPAAPAAPVEDPAPARTTPPPSDLLDRIGQAFTLHGYLRVRPELMHNFAIGWDNPSLLAGAPTAWANAGWPWARNPDNGIGAICSTSPLPNTTARVPGDCLNNYQTMANMRLRLEPEIHVTDSISVHTQIDIFDNLILGSTPQGYAAGRAQESSPWAPITAQSQTQVTPTERNSLVPSITVSRAWAEVTNATLGQIRFGRMPWNWGLGILANAGNGVDSDYQTHVDRVMYQLRYRPLSLFAAAMYDFASTGLTSASYRYETGQGQPIDISTLDDVHQVGLAVGRRVDAAEARQTLSRGDFVWNAGFYGLLRWQTLSSENAYSPSAPGNSAGGGLSGSDPRAGGDADRTNFLALQQNFIRRDALVFTGDAWFQLLHRNMRFEAEGVLVAGNTSIGATSLADPPRYNILQFGGALEFEYRLLNNRLQLEFRTGYASGDPDAEGLNYQTARLQPIRAGASTMTAFAFHPNYRVDLILWRQVMRAVSSAYYFRPGAMYVFVDHPGGDRFYGRASVIWSRASEFVQTRGNDANLGIEIDAELTYQSNWRDPTLGSAAAPGFFASLQYGILFPMSGLGPRADERAGTSGLAAFSFSNAQTLRGVVGVLF